MLGIGLLGMSQVLVRSDSFRFVFHFNICSSSVLVMNGSKLSQKNMVTKSVGTVYGIYTISCLFYLVSKCVSG